MIKGFFISFVESPVDFIKCQLQLRSSEYNSSFSYCTKKILSERGIRGRLFLLLQFYLVLISLIFSGIYQGLSGTFSRNCKNIKLN
jgi:hypothetical protein